MNLLFTVWSPAGAALVGLLAGLAALLPDLRRPGRHVALFGAGLGALLLALASPLDVLAGRYLLSAHMLQHLIVAQVVPPLLLLGLPATAVEQVLRRPAVASAEAMLRRPAVAWLLGIGALWVWHVPAIYVATMNFRLAQSATVLAAGLVFWWPIFAPATGSRMDAPAATLYLASACAASTLLGIALTFAPEVLYGGYLAGDDPYGVRMLCRAAGLTPLLDQQLGGLLMWVPCCLLYLSTVAGVLTRWYAAPELAAQ